MERMPCVAARSFFAPGAARCVGVRPAPSARGPASAARRGRRCLGGCVRAALARRPGGPRPFRRVAGRVAGGAGAARSSDPPPRRRCSEPRASASRRKRGNRGAATADLGGGPRGLRGGAPAARGAVLRWFVGKNSNTVVLYLYTRRLILYGFRILKFGTGVCSAARSAGGGEAVRRQLSPAPWTVPNFTASRAARPT